MSRQNYGIYLRLDDQHNCDQRDQQDDRYQIETVIIKDKIYVKIIFTPDKQNSYPWHVHAIAIPFLVIKFFASIGLRLYSLVDLFYNSNYMFYWLFSQIPIHISAPLIIYGVIGDGHMNLLTRAPSTYKMIAGWGCCCRVKDRDKKFEEYRGYTHCLKLPDTEVKKKHIYYEIVDGLLQYTVITPEGKEVTRSIEQSDFNYALCERLTIAELKPYLYDILQVTSKRKHAYPESFWRMVAKIIVLICSLFDTFGASLGTFLGIVTLLKYLTEDKTTLLTVGGCVFVSNIITNFAYRIRKAGNNLMDLIDGKLRWPRGFEWGIIPAATFAFLALCNYGTYHSLRDFFVLTDIYPGNPDANNENASLERLIYAIVYFTMGFSAVSFLLSQCAQMLASATERPGVGEIDIVFRSKEIRRNFYNVLHQRNVNAGFRTWYVMLPALLRMMAIWLGRICVPGEMLGNALLVFNSCIGLIVHLITDNPYAVAPTALVLVWVSSIIYWYFNIPDWLDNPKKMYVSSILYVLKKIGIWEETKEEYVIQLKRALLDSEQEQRHPPLESLRLKGLRAEDKDEDEDVERNQYSDTYQAAFFPPQNDHHRGNDRMTVEDYNPCTPNW